MTASWLGPWAALLVVGVGVPWVHGRTGPRRWGAFGLALVPAVLPWTFPASEWFSRSLMAMLGLLPLFKLVELERDPRSYPVSTRVWHTLSIFDARRARSTSPRFDIETALDVVLHGALFGLGLQLADWGRSSLILRAAGGLLVVVGLVVAVCQTVRWAYLLVGIDTPVIMRRPWLAVSVAEFWGRRWNATVSRWLHANVFGPLARRNRARWGIALAFGVSSVIHAWLVLPSLGLGACLSMVVFFMAQVPVLFVERWAHRRLPRSVRRAATVVTLTALSPLFTFPFLDIITSL